jgi:hypothetical protein
MTSRQYTISLRVVLIMIDDFRCYRIRWFSYVLTIAYQL